ncbi:MAG: hypothetical protein KY450_07410, partial [Actinobacteria bacterium]|nr:hypothetical protein [Actinomycetota bacterium]
MRAGTTISTFDSTQEVTRLRDAEAHLDTARARVRSLVVSPLRALPVVGRQLRSVDHLTHAGAVVSGTAADALGQVRALLEGGLPSGPERARLLDELGKVAAVAEDRLRAVDLGPDEALMGPLADGRARAGAELAEALERPGADRTGRRRAADLGEEGVRPCDQTGGEAAVAGVEAAPPERLRPFRRCEAECLLGEAGGDLGRAPGGRPLGGL